VGNGQGIADLLGEGDDASKRLWPAHLYQVIEIAPAAEFHHQVAFLGIEIVDADDVRGVELGEDEGVELETLHEVRVVGDQDLDRDLDAQGRVVRQVHHSLAALAQAVLDLVTPNELRKVRTLHSVASSSRARSALLWHDSGLCTKCVLQTVRV
jgi:hypothetical protein